MRESIKLIFGIPVLLILYSCNSGNKPQIQSAQNQNKVEKDTLILNYPCGFDTCCLTPEKTLESFFYAINNKDQEMTGRCGIRYWDFNHWFSGLKISGYSILQKYGLREDGLNIEKQDTIRIRAAILFSNKDTLVYTYSLLKKANKWQIFDFCSDAEAEMERDIQKAISEVPTSLDSLEAYRMKYGNDKNISK